MAKISDESITEFQEKLKLLEPSPATVSEILDGVIYLLYKNRVKITWADLEKKIETLIRENLKLKNPIYDCFKGISFNNYFFNRPARFGFYLTGRYLSKPGKNFIKTKHYEEFIEFIEKNSLCHLAAGPLYDVMKVIIIAQDLVKLISDDLEKTEL